MTRLGSKFVSEDTDARGQVGPTGEDSTVPGPAGADSTVPGPAGDDGLVNTIVAGTNITVDSSDPVNPIVNSTAGGVDPLTTKGDVFGFDTDAARIPVGANDEVLTADSTAALGVKWAAPAAGGGVVVTSIETIRVKSVAVSTSSNALKGGVYTVDTTFKLHKVSAWLIGNGSAGTYEMRVFEVSGATKIIDVLVGTSSSISAGANNDIQAQFIFSPALTITAGKEVAFCIVRTDGTGTAQIQVQLAATEVDAIPPYLTFVQFLVTPNNDPVVTDALGTQTNANSVGMTLFVE